MQRIAITVAGEWGEKAANALPNRCACVVEGQRIRFDVPNEALVSTIGNLQGTFGKDLVSLIVTRSH